MPQRRRRGGAESDDSPRPPKERRDKKGKKERRRDDSEDSGRGGRRRSSGKAAKKDKSEPSGRGRPRKVERDASPEKKAERSKSARGRKAKRQDEEDDRGAKAERSKSKSRRKKEREASDEQPEKGKQGKRSKSVPRKSKKEKAREESESDSGRRKARKKKGKQKKDDSEGSPPPKARKKRGKERDEESEPKKAKGKKSKAKGSRAKGPSPEREAALAAAAASAAATAAAAGPLARRRMTLGPVIGTVTGSTARVLCEFDFAGVIELRLRRRPERGKESESGQESVCLVYKKAKKFAAHRPVVFQFDDLEQHVEYDVLVPPFGRKDFGVECLVDDGSGRRVPVDSHFRTFTGNLHDGAFTAAVTSCNKEKIVRDLRKDGKRDVWDDLAERCRETPRQIDVVLHIGDQVYSDEIDVSIEGGDPDSIFANSVMRLYQPGVRRVKNEGAAFDRQKARDGEWTSSDAAWVFDGELRPRGEWEKERAGILEAYRGLYRGAWSIPSTRRALASVSNVMLFDDHDIADDWGDRRFHRPQYASKDGTGARQPLSPELFVGCCALQIYREYQRALRDPDCEPMQPLPEEPDDPWHFDTEAFDMRWGDIALLFLDTRSPRSFCCPPAQCASADPPLLCAPQLQMIERVLSSGGVRHLMVMSPVPLALFSPHMTWLGGSVINDLKGNFMYNQADMLFDQLRKFYEWKVDPRSPGREVTLFGGDIHVSHHTDVFFNNKPAFKQLVASSVGNANAGVLGRTVISLLERAPGQSSVGCGWKFKHHSMVAAARSYGIARTSLPPPPPGAPQGDAPAGPQVPPLVQLAHATCDDVAAAPGELPSAQDPFAVAAGGAPPRYVATSAQFCSPYRFAVPNGCGCCAVQ